MSLVLASADWCRNCGPAKIALTQAGFEFEVLNVDEEENESKLPDNLRGIPSLIKDNKIIAVGSDGITKWIRENA